MCWVIWCTLAFPSRGMSASLLKYKLGPLPPLVSAATLARLRAVQTATLGHFFPWGFVAPTIQALFPAGRVAGTAATLALPVDDSTLLHHALGLLGPGYVLVIDRCGDRRHACWGGGVTRAARNAGLAAAIVDGPCTDPYEIQAQGFPLWCRGVSAQTTKLRDIGGRFNQPVCCGGVAVCPGDAVLADECGIVVLPAVEAAAAAAAALELEAKIAAGEKRLEAGERLGEIYGASELVGGRTRRRRPPRASTNPSRPGRSK